MSSTKGALPAYLSRLAGGMPEAAPRLRPPRSLFPPAADALTDDGLAPLVGFADQADQAGWDRPGAGAGPPGSGRESSLRTDDAYAADRSGDHAGSGRPGGRNPASEAFAGLADAAGAAAGAAGMPAVRPLAFAPAAQGLTSGPGRGAMADPSLAPGRSTPGSPVRAVGLARSPGRDLLAAPVPAPMAATRGSEGRAAVWPGVGPKSPGSPPVPPSMAHPTAAAQITGATARPAPRPALGPASDRIPKSFGGNGERSATAGSAWPPAPAGAVPALVPPRPDPGAAELGGNRAARWSDLLNAPAPQARISIGTIEVTVVPPAPPHPPAAMAAPPAHLRARPGADGTGRTSAEVARQAVRGAARRWFGAGQS